MDFLENLHAISKKIKQSGSTLKTEEATKNALIMPFLSSVLGYDVFDPSEVIPEFTADVGTKKGEKVDYAIMKNGKIQLLIECKKYSEPLSFNHASQLFRYFSVTEARIAVLTNGAKYQFFTDLDANNKMDEKPFLELDLENIDENIVSDLKKLTKNEFDVDVIVSSAEELKYLQQIKKIINNQFNDPEDEFVKFFVSRCYDGKRATQAVIEQFKKFTSIALTQFVNDKTNERLKSAIEKTETAPIVVESDVAIANEDEEKVLAANDDELMAFNIVRAILCSIIPAERVVYRVAQSYFSIILDDNNRKPICRLQLRKSKKGLSLPNESKVFNDEKIENLEDIYKFSQNLRDVLKYYS